MTHPVSIGFLPLTDCAALVAARERGFAAAQGLALKLVRDTSWATARDRLIYRQVDAAHMLAPLAVAVSLGLGGYRTPLAAPLRLNVNGNQLVVSRAIAAALDLPAAARIADPAAAARAFAAWLHGHNGPPPVLAIVHRFSSHALLLRYWLGWAGIDPDRDVSLRVVPPSFAAEALGAGEIDGFCAGEPWGTVAVQAGIGETLAAGAGIWRGGVEKVLALRRDWMEANPDVTARLLRALDAAAAWCDHPANHADLATLLSQPHYLDRPAALILPALAGRLPVAAGEAAIAIPDFLMFHRGAAGFPWRSQALWIYAQFVRWGWLSASPTAEQAAAEVFRSDIYRSALANQATLLPSADTRLEGALGAVGANPAAGADGPPPPPDRFFDGLVFDPGDIPGYLHAQAAPGRLIA